MYVAEKTECVSDYIVSSYTPTISSLLRDIPASTSPFKMMAVIQPDAPGQKQLPCTLDELQEIETHVPDKYLVRLLRGSVEDTVSYLPAATIAHFACHGQQHAQNPLESTLVLHDGQLKVSQMMQRSMPNASLAFLSACETAMGNQNLPDEVIHLGATLLFAGFHGVVATLW
jgi:CHAT domain-containing protein